MKNTISILTILCIFLFLTVGAVAQTPGINKRQRSQQHKIKRGVRSGELTARETFRLEKQQHSIQKEKRAARSDGNVTKRERLEIRHDQNQARRRIFRAKHNNRDRN